MSMLFKRIKDWATSITAFRTGDYIAVDGTSGTAKMTKDDLIKQIAENGRNIVTMVRIGSAENAQAAFGNPPDLDNANNNTIYALLGTYGIEHLPVQSKGTLLTYTGNVETTASAVQLYVSYDNVMYFRSKWANAWTSWNQLVHTKNTPHAYGINVNNDTLAKSVLGDPIDFNTATENTIIRLGLNHSVPNCPESTAEGVLMFFCGMDDGSGASVQIFTHRNGQTFARLRWSNVFTPWTLLSQPIPKGIGLEKELVSYDWAGMYFNTAQNKIVDSVRPEGKIIYKIELPKLKVGGDILPSFVELVDTSSVRLGDYSQVFFFSSGSITANTDLTSIYLGTGRLSASNYGNETISKIPSGATHCLVQMDAYETENLEMFYPRIKFYYPHDLLLSSSIVNSSYDDCRINQEESKSILWAGGSLCFRWFNDERGYNDELLYNLPIDGMQCVAASGHGFSEARVQNVYSELSGNSAITASANIIVLWVSTNDYTNTQPIGNYTDCTVYDNYDATKHNSQCGGFNHCVKYIKDQNPSAQILCFLPLKFFAGKESYDPNTTDVNGTGYNFYNYTRELKKCCDLWGIPVLDLWNATQLSVENYAPFFVDTIHPNAKGYKRINKQILEFLKRFV